MTGKIIYTVLIAVFLISIVYGPYHAHIAAQSYSVPWIGLASITPRDMHAHIKFLAADELEGRDTASRGLKLASLYLISMYEKMRVEPGGNFDSYAQPFRLYSLEKLTEPTFIQITDTTDSGGSTKKYSLKADFIPFGYTANMEINAQVVWVGYGIDAPGLQFNEYENVDVRGKIALMMTHVPREKDRNCKFVNNGNFVRLSNLHAKMNSALRHGAIGMLLVTDPNNYNPSAPSEYEKHELKPIGSRWQNFASSQGNTNELLVLPEDIQPMVVAHISTGMAEDILAGTGKTLSQCQTEIDSTLLPRSFDVRHKTITARTMYEYSTKETENVVAVIEGSDPILKHEWIVYIAHYDHIGKSGTLIYNGADDNASGTAALLEIAEAFSVNPIKPLRSVVFVHCSGEEKGLLGSKYYVLHSQFAVEKTIACINLDMVSRNHPDSIHVIGSELLSSQFKSIIEEANGHDSRLLLGYENDELADPHGYFYRSDHYNFAERSIPSVFFFAGPHADYHKSTDTVEKINSEKAARVARLAYLTGWMVANREKPLTIDGPFGVENGKMMQ